MVERVQMETGVTGPDAPTEEVKAETTERPEWLPEKFESAEAMAKAYGELESKMGGNAPEGEQAKSSDDEEYEYEYEEGEATPESTGISVEAMEEFSNEFYENGDLSEKSLERIEKEFNIPQDIAKAYVEGQKALVEQTRNSIYNEVGGKDSYDAMLDWARDSLPEAEIAAYDAAIVSNDMNTAKMVAKGLHAQFTEAGGKAPALARGSASAIGGGEGYQSWQQVSADMRNPKYRTDPAYRDQVAQRLSVSKLK